MKTTPTFLQFVLCLFTTMSAACVSMDFKPAPPTKSETAQFVAPTTEFKEVTSAHLDHSWRNLSNGATISFLSECNSAVDPSLENIFKGITSELSNVDILYSNHVEYNSRDALHSRVEGKVDGVFTRFELLIFKKNNCTYILTYASAADVFASGQREFLKFTKGFVVP